MAQSHAVTKINWQKLNAVTSSLNKTTAASLQAFKKRHDELRRTTQLLEDSIPKIDFEAYRAILNNKEIVTKAQKTLADFKPVKSPIQEQLTLLAALEKKALEKAEATVKQVNFELQDLKETLVNIENARPVNQLTTNDIRAAEPNVDKASDYLYRKSRFTVPGHKETFGEITFF